MKSLAHFEQYSLIDCRPIFKMEDVCREYDIKLLTYGTLVSSCFLAPLNDSSPWQCGGFLSEKYLDVKIPDIYSETRPLTPSQRKVGHICGDFQHLISFSILT